jgi:hypothetical protein
MIRRKFIQLSLMVLSSSAALAVAGMAQASGGTSGASRNDSTSGASRNDSTSGASRNDSTSGASRSNDAGAGSGSGTSIREGGGSLYCNDQGICQRIAHDGLKTINDNDLANVLESFK